MELQVHEVNVYPPTVYTCSQNCTQNIDIHETLLQVSDKPLMHVNSDLMYSQSRINRRFD